MVDSNIMRGKVPQILRRRTRASDSDTEQLRACARVALRAPDDAAYQDLIKTFLGRCRPWMLRKRGMSSDAAAWAERHAIILHLMIGGATLREAAALLIRCMGHIPTQSGGHI